MCVRKSVCVCTWAINPKGDLKQTQLFHTSPDVAGKGSTAI